MSFIRNLNGTTTLYGLEAEAQAVFLRSGMARR